MEEELLFYRQRAGASSTSQEISIRGSSEALVEARGSSGFCTRHKYVFFRVKSSNHDLRFNLFVGLPEILLKIPEKNDELYQCSQCKHVCF